MSNTTAAGFVINVGEFIQLVIIATMAGWKQQLDNGDGLATFKRGTDTFSMDKNVELSFVTWEAAENIEDFKQLTQWIGNAGK